MSTSEGIHLKVNIHRKLFAQLAEITVVARNNYWIYEQHRFSQHPKAFLCKRESWNLGYFKRAFDISSVTVECGMWLHC